MPWPDVYGDNEDEESQTHNILGGPRDVVVEPDEVESAAPMSMADVCRENVRLSQRVIENGRKYFVASDRLREARRLLRLAVVGLDVDRSPDYGAYLSHEIRKFLEATDE